MDEDIRVIKKKDLRKILMAALKIDSRKTTRLINNFIDLGILEVKGYSYIVHKAKPPFLNIPIPTVKFCLEHMGDLDFKIYCVLLNMYNKHQYYSYKQNYFFSKKELLERICDLEADTDINYGMLEDILKRVKKIEKSLKPDKKEKK